MVGVEDRLVGRGSWDSAGDDEFMEIPGGRS